MVIKRAFITASLIFAAGIAVAEPVKLDGEAIRQALADKTVVGDQDGRKWRQVFHAGGSTTYREDGGRPSNGRWRVDGDRYCSVWPPSDFWACYDMAMDGETIIFIESGGTEWRATFVDE